MSYHTLPGVQIGGGATQVGKLSILPDIVGGSLVTAHTDLSFIKSPYVGASGKVMR
jgi:hypothetical protein